MPWAGVQDKEKGKMEKAESCFAVSLLPGPSYCRKQTQTPTIPSLPQWTLTPEPGPKLALIPPIASCQVFGHNTQKSS